MPCRPTFQEANRHLVSLRQDHHLISPAAGHHQVSLEDHRLIFPKADHHQVSPEDRRLIFLAEVDRRLTGLRAPRLFLRGEWR